MVGRWIITDTLLGFFWSRPTERFSRGRWSTTSASALPFWSEDAARRFITSYGFDSTRTTAVRLRPGVGGFGGIIGAPA